MIFVLDVLLVEVLMLDELATEEVVEAVHPPMILGTASVPVPIATIFVPQFAA